MGRSCELDSFKFLWLGYLKPPPFPHSIFLWTSLCRVVAACQHHLGTSQAPFQTIYWPSQSLTYQVSSSQCLVWGFRGVTYFDDDDDEYGGDDVDGDVGDDGEEDDDVSAGCNSRGDKSEWKQWRQIKGGPGMQGHQRGADWEVMVMITRCYWCWWWLIDYIGHDVGHGHGDINTYDYDNLMILKVIIWAAEMVMKTNWWCWW